MINSFASNSLGKFSGSKPKDLITRSAGILYSEPSSTSGLLLPEESGLPNFILLTSTASIFVSPIKSFLIRINIKP